FREDDRLQVITKKVIIATDEEIRANPRSRSAKLRIAEKK
ncbi:MAG: 16S rRNA (cytosine(1402)-N(4))-methyltransferase, partial [Pseudanabaena sp.]